ncbi:MAG TPA: carboxypeptidase regulatory-like domain-containing protein [Candidatus Acidoferrum sp.]|nr:carboxypeptidase regulatory-like domain-containing protein [Candidatus Acidoferrum sp.]
MKRLVFHQNSIYAMLAVASLLSCLAPHAFASAQTSSSQIQIRGTVTDPVGACIPNATITLDPDSEKSFPPVNTNQDGSFELQAEAGKNHVLRVAYRGFKTRNIEIPARYSQRDSLQIALEVAVIRDGIDQPGGKIPDVQFSDSPNFTVAGVTDWSNVGLHGSDVNVKTSEALTKDAAALKSSSGSAPANSEADAHRKLGDEKEESGDPVAAEHEYELAAKLDPSEQNYFSWGAELLLHRAGAPAVEVLTKGVALHAKSQRMIEALGAALYANGQYPEAALQMCRAADLNPDDPEPYLFLGRIEASAKDTHPCSEDALRRFVSEQPKNADANFYYGMVLLKNARRSQREADFKHAESVFQNALANRPSFGEVYVQLGLLYNAQGQKDAALREFQNAVRVAPHLSDAHYQLSLASRRAGDAAKADEEMKKYEELQNAEEAALEKQRKEMKQFVTILQQSSPKQ